MNLSADILLDRALLKEKLNRWRIISLFTFLGLFTFIVKDNFNTAVKKEEYIARIKINKIITENDQRNKALDDIIKNDSIKAVIMHVNSPGGTFVGAEDIYLALHEISKTKPVVAVMGTVAASGGYMASIAADYVIAHKGTITGSIGVILQSAEISEFAKKIGVNFLTYKSGKFKATPSFTEPPSAEINEAIKSTIMDNYDIFVDMVAERRNLPKEEVLRLADGRIYTGRQALANKLIDAIGSEKEALKWLITEHKIKEDMHIKNINLIEEKHFYKKYLSKITSLINGNNLSTTGLSGILALWTI
ncbi:MAG: signal peptide peptidase SppA [Alphaproteobacteria bacterium]